MKANPPESGLSGKNKEIADDISFVFEECARFAKMSMEEIKKEPRADLMSSLPHPSGMGMMICGRAASVRMEKLAKEAGRRAGLTRRVTLRTLRIPAEKLLVDRFLKEKRSIDTKQIDRYLAAVGRKALEACEDITHFVPCTMMTTQDPETLVIGPVTFRNRASYRREFLKHKGEHARDADDWRTKLSRRLVAEAAWFYRQFDRVAVVKIYGCDSDTSAQVAERAVTSALDCLHLILQVQNTRKMRIGGPALGNDRRAGVTIRKDGKMYGHSSSSASGQVNFPDGWSRRLSDPDMEHLLTLCGVAIEAAVDPDLLRPLSRRFLDAAQWFGEAARDDRPATKVVKYVTALERMVMTDEMDDISKSVSERVAALCCNRVNANDRGQWRDDAKAIYDLRSRLVHGSISPLDSSIEHGVWTAARLGEETLLSVLDALGIGGLRAEEVSTKRLAKWYGQILTTMDLIETNADSISRVSSEGAETTAVEPSTETTAGVS